MNCTRRNLLAWLAAAVMWTSAMPVSAAEGPRAFDAANRLYAEGKFRDAVAAYQTLLSSGWVSSALYFNLGNAWFKSGELGHAIAAYRTAEHLAPRDPDIRANLQFARRQVQGPTLPASQWRGWLEALTLNEWTVLAAAALWLIFLLLALAQLKPAWQRRLRVYVAAVTGAALVLFGCLAVVLFGRYDRPFAIVVAREAVVRSSPFAEAPTAFTAHDGAELDVLDQKDGWFQVTDGAQPPGWVKSDAVQVVGAQRRVGAETRS